MMTDYRPKSILIGFRDEDNDEQIAFTKSFIQEKGVYNTTVGGKNVAIKYYPRV